MKRVEHNLVCCIYNANVLKETRASGHTGYNEENEVTLHGNKIAGVSYSPILNSNREWVHWNTYVEWINLCGYPTNLTMSRLRALSLPIYKKNGQIKIDIAGKTFDVLNNGVVPIGDLLRLVYTSPNQPGYGHYYTMLADY
jgi:hypothetical protein